MHGESLLGPVSYKEVHDGSQLIIMFIQVMEKTWHETKMGGIYLDLPVFKNEAKKNLRDRWRHLALDWIDGEAEPQCQLHPPNML